MYVARLNVVILTVMHLQHFSLKSSVKILKWSMLPRYIGCQLHKTNFQLHKTTCQPMKMLFLYKCVSTSNLAKNAFAYQSQKIVANFMKILGLRRTRCMCDVFCMYLWRLHDECAAYCYTLMIKIILHSITSDPL